MKDRQAKTKAHVRHGGPSIGLAATPDEPWLLKHHLRYPTSSGRGSHQIIHTTCRQVITIPIICPRVIQVTITQACHRIRLSLRDACAKRKQYFGVCALGLMPYAALLIPRFKLAPWDSLFLRVLD